MHSAAPYATSARIGGEAHPPPPEYPRRYPKQMSADWDLDAPLPDYERDGEFYDQGGFDKQIPCWRKMCLCEQSVPAKMFCHAWCWILCISFLLYCGVAIYGIYQYIGETTADTFLAFQATQKQLSAQNPPHTDLCKPILTLCIFPGATGALVGVSVGDLCSYSVATGATVSISNPSFMWIDLLLNQVKVNPSPDPQHEE